jgi:hypothetical protein
MAPNAGVVSLHRLLKITFLPLAWFRGAQPGENPTLQTAAKVA